MGKEPHILLKILKEKKENFQHFEFDILTHEMVVRGQLVAWAVTDIKNLWLFLQNFFSQYKFYTQLN